MVTIIVLSTSQSSYVRQGIYDILILSFVYRLFLLRLLLYLWHLQVHHSHHQACLMMMNLVNFSVLPKHAGKSPQFLTFDN